MECSFPPAPHKAEASAKCNAQVLQRRHPSRHTAGPPEDDQGQALNELELLEDRELFGDLARAGYEFLKR